MATQKYNMVKNVFFSTITTFSSFFLFVLLIFVGRLTGVEQNGIFNAALAVATVFEMFTDLGLRDLTARNVSRDRTLASKYIGNLLTWKLMLCTLAYVAMLLVVAAAYDYSPEVRTAIYILTISAFLKSMKYTFRVFFQAYDLFAWDTGLVLFERTTMLIVCLSVLFIFKSILAFIIAFTAVRLIDFIVAMIVVHVKIAKIKPQFDWGFIRHLQKEALPLGMFFIILTLFSYIDIIMLSKMSADFNAAGLYSAGFRIYEGVTILPTILYLVALPRLSELWVKDRTRHTQFANRVVKYMFVMAVPVVVFGYFFSDFFIRLFYSSQPDFFPATFTLQLLFLGILFQYPNWMLDSILISIDKQKIIMLNGTGGLVLKILLNLWIIPRYSYEGAAFATIFGQFLIFSMSAFYLVVIHHLKLPIIRIAVKPVLIGGVLAAGFYFGLPYVPLWPLAIVLGGVYLAGLLVLNVFDKKEKDEFVKNLLSFVKPSA
ncbi:flippase [bacterium]|nr:flippase [bacterium]